MYHRFDEPRYPSTNVTMAQFKAQLDYLDNHGFRIWPLERLVDHLKKGKPVPYRTVAITVDDAYRSVYDHAYPALKARGWPFTVFVSSEVVDRGLPAYMDWDQMREMAADGVTFGNHSAGHDHLIERLPGESEMQWRERVKADIVRAEARMNKELGGVAKLFAYPYGEFNEALAKVVADLGYTAFGQQSGAVDTYSDFRALPRYPIAEAFADLDGFRVKANSLALPVSRVTPWDPVLSDDKRPLMEVTLVPSNARLDELRCYASGQGQVPVRWISKEERRFSVQAVGELQGRRARYNCTAPSSNGRYYWFSHLWIDPRQPEE